MFNVYYGCSLFCELVKIHKMTLKFLYCLKCSNLTISANIGTVCIHVLHIHSSRINFTVMEQYILKCLKLSMASYDKMYPFVLFLVAL